MKSVLLRLKEGYDSFSTAEKHIATYIRENAHECTTLTIRDLAQKSFTSPSSIVRLCRIIDFNGYKELKHALIIELASFSKDYQQQETLLSGEENISKIIDKITMQNIKSLEDTLYLVDEKEIEKCIELLLKSKTILLFGIGSSQLVAHDFHLKMLRINKPCHINNDVHSQLLQAKNSTKEDVAIIYSYSGETKEMMECLSFLLINQTPTIAITRYATSKLTRNATHKLYISASEPLFRHGAMSSRLAQLNMNDILYSGMISKEFDQSINQVTLTYINKE